MNETAPMDPHTTVCVVRNTHGKEIGRIAATASNASAYIDTLIQHAGGGSVDYEEDQDAAMISRLLNSRR